MQNCCICQNEASTLFFYCSLYFSVVHFDRNFSPNCMWNKQNCRICASCRAPREFHTRRTKAFLLPLLFILSILVEQPGTSLNRDPLCIIFAETDLTGGSGGGRRGQKGGLWTKNKCDSCCFRGTTNDEKMQIMSTCLDKLFRIRRIHRVSRG